MIYTVTLNPALDYVVSIDKLRFDDINRTDFEEIMYGGKGINVSVILTRLGVKNKAIGFKAGFTGEKLVQMLDNDGIDNKFVSLESGFTRINVKVKSNENIDINATGPKISKNDLEKLMLELKYLKKGDTIVFAGSIPPPLPECVYEKMMTSLEQNKVNFVVDATGDLLLNSLKFKPFLIKPNHYELGELFGVEISSEKEIIKYAKKLQQLGAKNVLVSMGKSGAVLVAENGKIYKCGTIDGNAINDVGCGDSMLAGFLAGYEKTKDFSHALSLGSAAGNATAFSIGLAEKKEIKEAFEILAN